MILNRLVLISLCLLYMPLVFAMHLCESSPRLFPEPPTTDSFEVSTCQDLQDISTNVRGKYRLINNIDCSTVDFVPIPAFSGTLDGQGYTIDGLTIDAASNSTGLFATLTKATVKDISITNASVSGNGNTGTLCGVGYGVTLENITIQTTVFANGPYSGGLCGLIATVQDDCTGKIIKESDLRNIHVDVQMTSDSGYAGGLSGAFVGSDIEDCSVVGSLAHTNFDSRFQRGIGGIMGIVEVESELLLDLTGKLRVNLSEQKGIGEATMTSCMSAVNVFSSATSVSQGTLVGILEGDYIIDNLSIGKGQLSEGKLPAIVRKSYSTGQLSTPYFIGQKAIGNRIGYTIVE